MVSMAFFIPGTDSKIFQGARRVFTFHIEIFSLLSEPTVNSVMKRLKCEKSSHSLKNISGRAFDEYLAFLRLIEIYLYAIIIFNLPSKVD